MLKNSAKITVNSFMILLMCSSFFEIVSLNFGICSVQTCYLCSQVLYCTKNFEIIIALLLNFIENLSNLGGYII
jgi:hypothetical protein